jgi:hypothetical protein
MKIFAQGQSASEEGQVFKAGEACTDTGIYRAFHYQHRSPHTTFVAEGEAFPPCRRCKDRIYFKLVVKGRRWQEEYDLSAQDHPEEV